MWMVDCERSHDQGFNKLRPLMPRQITLYGSHPTGFPAVTPTGAWNCGAPLVSSRWNPTPEQLQALEEMYRWGMRTPSADQIQQIAAKLRRFGKIEGKNVFYWFQNHKARERQKKRRHEIELSSGRKLRHLTEQGRQSGMKKGDCEIGQPKKLSPPNSSQYSESTVEDIRQKGRWAQMELQQEQKGTTEFNCCQLDLCSCLSPSSSNNNNNNSRSNLSAQKVQENSNPFVIVLPTMFPSKDDDGWIENLQGGTDGNDHDHDQTLQLFPVQGSDSLGTLVSDDRNHPAAGYSGNSDDKNKLVPNQFFEFLPTKI